MPMYRALFIFLIAYGVAVLLRRRRGNDGLTRAERKRYAASYMARVSAPLSAEEKKAIARVTASRG